MPMYHWCSKGSYRYVRPSFIKRLSPRYWPHTCDLIFHYIFGFLFFAHLHKTRGRWRQLLEGIHRLKLLLMHWYLLLLHIPKISLLICYSSPSKYKLDRWFVKRFWRCWKVMTPSCSSTTFLLFVLLVGFALAGKKARTIISKNRFR